MGYWSLKAQGYSCGYQSHRYNDAGFTPLSQDQFAVLERLLEVVVPKLASGIHAGKFPVENEDPDCTSRCAYHTTCRVNQIRSIASRLMKYGDLTDRNDDAHRKQD